MNLTELKPKESSFYLKSAKRSFKMNPITLADECWLNEEYGDKIQEIFTNVNIKEISRIVFRLMDTEDKKFFKTREITIIDEEGNEDSGELGGVDLLRTMVIGFDDKISMLNALVDNVGISRPEVKEKDTKKKAVKKKKKTK